MGQLVGVFVAENRNVLWEVDMCLPVEFTGKGSVVCRCHFGLNYVCV